MVVTRSRTSDDMIAIDGMVGPQTTASLFVPAIRTRGSFGAAVSGLAGLSVSVHAPCILPALAHSPGWAPLPCLDPYGSRNVVLTSEGRALLTVA